MTVESIQDQATALCKACGLCCSGHLFGWVKLRSPEMEAAQELGLPVLGTNPNQRGFNQPCPLWDGECTIYTSAHYPRACKTYQCALLKKLLEESIPFSEALAVVARTRHSIRELESHLPASLNANFRERLVALMEHLTDVEQPQPDDIELEQSAKRLLLMYAQDFGVKDLVENLEET